MGQEKEDNNHHGSLRRAGTVPGLTFLLSHATSTSGSLPYAANWKIEAGGIQPVRVEGHFPAAALEWRKLGAPDAQAEVRKVLLKLGILGSQQII